MTKVQKILSFFILFFSSFNSRQKFLLFQFISIVFDDNIFLYVLFILFIFPFEFDEIINKKNVADFFFLLLENLINNNLLLFKISFFSSLLVTKI